MAISTKLIKMQLAAFKPFVGNLPLEAVRKGQDTIGQLLVSMHHGNLSYEEKKFETFEGVWAIPEHPSADGVVLFLHGGGYIAGDLQYAKGAGSIFADKNQISVFCPAYRLAPEAPYPAALEDAMTAYQWLLEQGYGKKIIVAGESAGGGLAYALCLRLRALGLEMPAGVVGISPWTDLTASGGSYEENKECDPSMTKERLAFYAAAYAGGDIQNPYVSPLQGDLCGMPPSLLFAGGDEVMLDDARLLHEKLTAAGCESRLHVAPGMWHVYVLYCVPETREDYDRIGRFIREVLGHEA